MDNQKEQEYAGQLYKLCEKYYILTLRKSVKNSVNTPAADTSNVALFFCLFKQQYELKGCNHISDQKYVSLDLFHKLRVFTKAVCKA